MEDRRTSSTKSRSVRRQFSNSRDEQQRGNSQRGPGGGKKRFFKKRSASSEAKMPPPRPGSRPRTKKLWEKTAHAKITSDLQITDGRYQGNLLDNLEKLNSDLNSRKIRESLFRLIARRVRAARFLDICAGNGTMGIEALSRGAMLGSFVERSARMSSIIKRNLDSCGVKPGHFEIFQMEAIPFLRRVGRRRRFWDVVYCATPCDSDYDGLLKCFGNGYSIRPGGMLIMEHPSDVVFPEKVGLLKRWRVFSKDAVALTLFERI